MSFISIAPCGELFRVRSEGEWSEELRLEVTATLEDAIGLVLKQAEVLADDWTGKDEHRSEKEESPPAGEGEVVTPCRI